MYCKAHCVFRGYLYYKGCTVNTKDYIEKVVLCMLHNIFVAITNFVHNVFLLHGTVFMVKVLIDFMFSVTVRFFYNIWIMF